MTSRRTLHQSVDPLHMLGAAVAVVSAGVGEQHAESGQVRFVQCAASEQHGQRHMQQIGGLP